jgi:secretion/DNA translocation related CpaE-like protein
VIQSISRRGPEAGSSSAGSAPKPIVVTTDDELLDDVLRVAAAAGAAVEVVPDAGAARAKWSPAPMVVIGEDQADALAYLAPGRRPAVYLIGSDGDDPTVWRRAVAIGAEHVVFLPEDESWLADRLADAAEGRGSDALVIGVIGGRGGAGASVLATALAVTASRRGLSAMLVDLDALGGGVDLVLGAEDTTGLRWPDLADSRGRLSARALQAELPGRHGLAVLSWDRGDLLTVSPESAHVVLAAASRACDIVTLDLPRRLDPAAEEAVAACTAVLLVVPAEVRAVAAASRVAATLTTMTGDVRVVCRGPAPNGRTGTDVAAALGLPLAAQMAPERRISEQLDRGETPGLDHRGPLANAASQLVEQFMSELQSSAA